MELKTVISTRLPVNVGEALVREAEAKKVKLSPLVERILTDHVQRQSGNGGQSQS